MAEIIEVKGKDGRDICKLQRTKGILEFAAMPGFEKRQEKLQELKAKEGDVIIANYPKTGNKLYFAKWLIQRQVHYLKK